MSSGDLRLMAMADAARFARPREGDSDEVLFLRAKLLALLTSAEQLHAENTDLRERLSQHEEMYRWNKRGWNA